MPASRLLAALLLGLLIAGSAAFAEEEEVFSGPQEGERLADFKILDVLENEGKSFQYAEKVGDNPVLLIFVHKVTRPSIGLVRMVVDEANRLRKDDLKVVLVMLGEDVTATLARVKQIRHALPREAILGVSPDKQEGPGAYGLNRNVTLTVLAGRDGKVVENFALIQPSVQADGIKIVQAAYKAAGKKEAPTLGELMLRNIASDELRKPLLKLIDTDADDRDPEKLIAHINQLVKEKPRLKGQLQGAAGRLITMTQNDKIEDSVRQAIMTWRPRRRANAGRAMMSDQVSGMLRSVIRKDASEEEVIKANEALEKHLAANPRDKAAVGRAASTIVSSGKIDNYGTEKAREFIRQWAKKYGSKTDAPRRR